MKCTALALLCGFVLGGAQAAAQENRESPEATDRASAVYVVGVTGMT